MVTSKPIKTVWLSQADMIDAVKLFLRDRGVTSISDSPDTHLSFKSFPSACEIEMTERKDS